ncbi:hypothetical protein, partial [Ralstonia pseudosolanacearum]|uniref:hypothetical protein n=1 Tax=Ralstonia pseudosolanacearum TaxID=1310165 RepID=UPI0020063F52
MLSWYVSRSSVPKAWGRYRYDIATDLSQFGSAQSVDQQGSNGLRRIDSQLDLLGRATQQTLAARY